MISSNKKNREGSEVNASSTADIAFLLLIFFLVTTTIDVERGLTLLLPEKKVELPPVPIHERNIFKVLINSEDKLLVRGKPITNYKEIKPLLKEFILNNGINPELSDNPQEAVVSFKTNRGTSYAAYIGILDELKGTYYEIYGERIGLSAEEYRSLDENNIKEKELLKKGREGIPMNISIAEPSK